MAPRSNCLAISCIRLGNCQDGDAGLTMLIYGTRKPNDLAYYPRSNKIAFRGLGVIGRIESLDYWDGEPNAG